VRPLHVLLFVALSVALLGISGSRSAAHIDSRTDLTPQHEILVRYGDVRASHSSQSFLSTGEAPEYNPRLDAWVIRLPPDVPIAEALARLNSDPNVLIAQPNYTYVAARAPNDPDYREFQRPYYSAINARAGWEIETGSDDVVVAVLDGGVDTAHPELISAVWSNSLEILNGFDDDGNGCVDDVHGCSFHDEPPNGDIADRDGHGTFVAGIIGADSNNAEGVAGVAWAVTIMPVRVLDPDGIGTTEQLASGILYAAASGADVINLSLALVPEEGICSEDPIVEEALRAAHEDFNVTIVAAGGNLNINCVAYPAASSYVIAVGGAGTPVNPDTRAHFSQWGPEIDLAAPAIDIFSTLPENRYGTNDGTSFAAPIVAGSAALLLAQDESRSPEDIRRLLRDTARDLPDDLRPNWDGAGMLDLGAALGGESTFATLDLTARDVSNISIAVLVGDPGDPLCSTSVWNHPSVSGRSMHGSQGLDQCGSYWPPTADQPWQLVGSSANGKSATLRAWSVRAGDSSCSAADVPAPIPVDEGVISTIRCLNDGIVRNDRAEQALPIDPSTIPRRYDQDIRYATSSGDPSLSCAEHFSRSVWHVVGPGISQSAIAADTFGTEFDTVLGLFVEGDSGLVEIACNDEFGSPQSRVTWKPDGVSDYYIMAAAFQAVPAGRLMLNVSPAYIPRNDSRAEATTLPLLDAFPAAQPAHSATAAPNDPALSCASSYGFSVWFEAGADLPGAVALETQGSDYDTVLGVFREDEDQTLTEVACNDDASADERTSYLRWQPIAGESYKIVVGSFGRRGAGALRLGAWASE